MCIRDREIKDLKVNYKTFGVAETVLDIDYIGIERGKTFGIVGESRSGKTDVYKRQGKCSGV